MPGTAKVLDWNLTRTCFFFKREILFQIKLSADYLSAYLLSAKLSHLEMDFFSLCAFS